MRLHYRVGEKCCCMNMIVHPPNLRWKHLPPRVTSSTLTPLPLRVEDSSIWEQSDESVRSSNRVEVGLAAVENVGVWKTTESYVDSLISLRAFIKL